MQDSGATMSEIKITVNRMAGRAWWQASPFCPPVPRTMRVLFLLTGFFILPIDARAQDKQEQPSETPETAAAKFEKLDTDSDKRLSEAEFLAPVSETNQTRMKRDFHLFDLDHDGFVTYEEFLNIPSLVRKDERGRLPDPIVQLMEKRLAELETKWKDWDQNNDGKLDRGEFESAKLTAAVPGLSVTTWDDWQREGAVSLQDCRRVLEAAYGVRRLDGTLLRVESGLVIDWTSFQRVDEDADGRIDRKALLKFYESRNGREWTEKTFKEADVDGDGVITFAEWAGLSQRWIDPIVAFRQLDKDLDGRLGPEEFIAGAKWWRAPQAPFIFQAFDRDGNDFLSLEEYRLTPFANELIRWDLRPIDANNDGRIEASEFPWSSGVELSALTAEYFRLLDRNADGSLDQTEFDFQTKFFDASALFAARDRDADQRLTEAEFLSPVAEGKQAAAKRDFRVFDLNGDGTLTEEEFLSIPSVIPKEHRKPIPDPVIGLMESQLSEITSRWSGWDRDGDGILNREEFTRSGLTRSIPGLAMASWDDWSRGGEGRVTIEDCRTVLEIAYGVRRPAGELLRTRAGLVIDWTTFQRVDVDSNDRITSKEYVDFFGHEKLGGPAKAKADFEVADTNRDGTIIFREWAALPRRQLDPISDFLKWDKNLDGKLSQSELAAGAQWWRELLVPHVIRGFDLNGDGLLSLQEYRLTPLANEIARWDQRPRDADNDGRISPGEFRFSSGIALAALTANYFQMYDLDRSGFLELEEYSFLISSTRAPRRVVFKSWDTNRDGQLALDEIMARHKKGTKESDVAYEKKVARIEEAFHLANLDGDSGLSPTEFESDAAKGVISPTSRVTPKVAKANRGGGPGDDETSWRMWIIVSANVLLVGAVAVFLTRKG